MSFHTTSMVIVYVVQKLKGKIMDAQKKINKLTNIIRACKLHKLNPQTLYAAVDFEYYEHNQARTTEVGISLFNNTGDIITHHLVVDEYYNLRNGRYVADNKDNFDYGVSERISKDDLADHVQVLLTGVDILIVHGGKDDRKALRELGVDFTFVRALDTQQLFKVYSHEMQSTGLAKMYKVLIGKEMQNAHNGGNDSHCTAECFRTIMNGIGFKDRVELELETVTRIQEEEGKKYAFRLACPKRIKKLPRNKSEESVIRRLKQVLEANEVPDEDTESVVHMLQSLIYNRDKQIQYYQERA